MSRDKKMRSCVEVKVTLSVYSMEVFMVLHQASEEMVNTEQSRGTSGYVIPNRGKMVCLLLLHGAGELWSCLNGFI